jgi:hypothetical protein
MQVGAAHGAGKHLKQNLAVRGFRHGAIAEREQLARLLENHRAHQLILAQ